jgi:hypothetical protein
MPDPSRLADPFFIVPPGLVAFIVTRDIPPGRKNQKWGTP